jgi:hypothetical protein
MDRKEELRILIQYYVDHTRKMIQNNDSFCDSVIIENGKIIEQYKNELIKIHE